MSENFNNKQHAGITNVDKSLLLHVKKKWNVTSMLDIGCGPGDHVMTASNIGINAYGVDGTDIIPQLENFQQIDYREKCSTFDIKFDLGWSVEFLEHVEEEFKHIYIKDFIKCNILIITAAPLGWGGNGHVNEQPEEYWVDFFENYNFLLDKEKTKEIRRVSNITNGQFGKPRGSKKQFVKNRGLVFINQGENI
jgi:SAM-dependent methyltransferase